MHDVVLCSGGAAAQPKKPNVVYFLVDNLGMGELSSYSGGPFRGVTTSRIDAFAKEGMMLLNFAPEAQCTPSRSAKPFFLYFDHSMLHLPVIPRAEFKGKTGKGDWADSLLELDTDFGTLLDYLKQLGISDNTVVVFSGDNGPEEAEPWRGTAGYFEGSYFTGMEGSLRTPALMRYPGHVPAGQKSNEVVHITDMFTTLLLWAGLEVPKNRVIDGMDQRAFFEGKQTTSNREGFSFWLGNELYGVKWRNFKLLMVEQKTLTDPALPLPNPHLINLGTDPKEREPVDYPYLHTCLRSITRIS